MLFKQIRSPLKRKFSNVAILFEHTKIIQEATYKYSIDHPQVKWSMRVACM